MLTIARIQAGDAYNVIPQKGVLAGTVRTLKRETMSLIEQNLRRLATSIATGFAAAADVDFRVIAPPTVNDHDEMMVLAAAAGQEASGDGQALRGRPERRGGSTDR